MAQIILPANNWEPRPEQRAAWDYLRAGGKRCSLWWHRRCGKDEICLHHSALSAMERVGNYWHMLPEASQARRALWHSVNPTTGMRRVDEAFPFAIRAKTLEQEMMIEFVNGSTWQVLGSDNYKSLVGAPPIGLVLSEWSKAQPQAWAYLSPILLANGGWAVFPTTPMGKNHAYSTHEAFRNDPGAFAQTLTAYETSVFTTQQLESERRNLIDIYGHTLGSALFAQEYECSAEAAVLGAVYAGEIAQIRNEGRIRPLHVAQAPVYTAWDIGRFDATAIWFFQIVAGEIRILDFYEASLEDLDHYVSQIKGRTIINPMADWAYTGNGVQWGQDIPELEHRQQYDYAMHYLPHDAKHKRLEASGVSIEQMLRKALGRVAVVQADSMDFTSQIAMSRAAMRKATFDPRASAGLEALSMYRYNYDEHRRTLSQKPLHDWTSHAADAWRMLGIAASQILSESSIKHTIAPLRRGRASTHKGSAWVN